MSDRIVLYLLDDQGFCYKERRTLLNVAGFNPGDTVESREFSQYFHVYWIRNPQEIWGCTFLISKTQSKDASLLNGLLPDIFCVDYALKARPQNKENYEFSPPVEVYVMDNYTGNDQKELLDLLNLSPLPALREVAANAGIKQDIIDKTIFNVDNQQFDPPEDADYTKKVNDKLCGGAIDSMGALGGRLMHLLIANSYGTVCVGLTAHNIRDFKQTELAYAEYILGESRDNVTFLCTQSGDQHEKNPRALMSITKEGVKALRERLVNLYKSGIINFNLFELQDLLNSVSNQDALLSEDKSITIKTNVGERKLPLNGLFIDHKKEKRASEVYAWITCIIGVTRLNSVDIQKGKECADGLFESYENEQLRQQRYDLSILLSHTINHWNKGSEGLPDDVKNYLLQGEKQVSRKALAYHCDELIQRKKGQKKKKRLMQLHKKSFDGVALDAKNSLDCMNQLNSSVTSITRNESQQRWTIFFVYARLCCEYVFYTRIKETFYYKLDNLLWKKMEEDANKTDETKSELSLEEPLIKKEDIRNNIKPKKLFVSRGVINKSVLYDALFPLPQSPLILPWHCKDSLSKSWKLPVEDIDKLVKNGLSANDPQLFREGEFAVIQDYCEAVWEELKNKSIKLLNE